MDKFDKIVTLIEHGYTKEEIEKILPADDEPEAAAAPEPEAPAEETAAPEPEAPAAAPAELPEALTGFMAEVKASIAELTKAVQAGNVNRITTDTKTAEDMNDVLASFINPSRK